MKHILFVAVVIGLATRISAEGGEASQMQQTRVKKYTKQRMSEQTRRDIRDEVLARMREIIEHDAQSCARGRAFRMFSKVDALTEPNPRSQKFL